jgi:dolichol-phosphate mannosyltransferase
MVSSNEGVYGMSDVLVSVVLPVFNEEDNVSPAYEKLSEVFDGLKREYDTEFIFVDDGSRDRSLVRLRELAKSDERVKVVSFSRNFGHQAALTAGMGHARGDVVVTMDCDLQDPPELIVEMLEKWRQGNKIVYARRVVRDDRPFKKITAAVYYRLLGRVSNVEIPRQVGDFRLMDRTVVQELLRLGEHAQYLRGQVAWLGFKHAFVDFERPERIHGETHYPLHKMLKLAMDGLLSFSFSPLKLGLFIGLFSMAFSFVLFVAMLWYQFVVGFNFPVYKWLVVALFCFVGLQFIFLWIIGEYVGRIYNDVRRRPLYVVAEKINLEDLSQ